MDKLKLLYTSSRPISWINTAFPFAATYLILNGGIDTRLIIGSLFFLIPYNLLMYGVNDVYDYESDLRNPRKGGVEGAVVPKKYHRFLLSWSYLLTVPFLAYLLITGDLISNLVLLACLFFVIAYSIKGLRFKERPVLDSITSSLHFSGPMIYALSLFAWPEEAISLVVAFFLWGMASHSFGAVQDIMADREAKISSIATIFGAKATVLFSTLLYLAATVVLVSTGEELAAVVGAINLLYICNVVPFLSVTDKTAEKTRAGWKRFLVINYIAGTLITFILIGEFLVN